MCVAVIKLGDGIVIALLQQLDFLDFSLYSVKLASRFFNLCRKIGRVGQLGVRSGVYIFLCFGFHSRGRCPLTRGLVWKKLMLFYTVRESSMQHATPTALISSYLRVKSHEKHVEFHVNAVE